MSVRLTEMDLYSAKRVENRGWGSPTQPDGNMDIVFDGYCFKRDENQPLKEK